MKKFLITVVVTFTTTLLSYGQVSAKGHDVALEVKNIIELDFVSSLTNPHFVFNQASDYDNGKTLEQAGTFKVRSNIQWIVDVKTATTFFQSNNGYQGLSASKLSIRKNGETVFKSLSTTPQVLTTGPRGGFDLNNFQIDYFAAPSYILPGEYTIDVIFTLSAP
jgi:hypothetical protein